MLDLAQLVRRHLAQGVHVVVRGVRERDAQDLEVEALLVPHPEHAHRAGPDVAAGERRLVDEQHGVRVVAVIGAGPLDEPVVEVVVDG